MTDLTSANNNDSVRLGQTESEQAIAPDSMGALLAISYALSGRLQLEQVLSGALKLMDDVVSAEGSSILLIDPATGGMQFYVAAGPAADKVMKIPLPSGAGICGHVAGTGESLVINDAQNDPRFDKRVDKATSMVTRNILCVPIRSHERMWGVLELINKKGTDGFHFEDLRLAEVLAAQTGLALENAHLHTQIVETERMAAVGKTVSGLAHCIKNILNGIRSGSAVVDRSLGADNLQKVRQGWATVSQNNEMLGNLVLDMLSLARESKPHLFATEINGLADQVCKLMEAAANQRDINIAFTPAKNLDDVLADPTYVYRCLLNLVSNAVEACDQGGQINVRVYYSKQRGRFTISVADNGPGIPAENRAKMFTEFFTTKGGRGTGLGLPVTKKLVTELGGQIKYHSVPGLGTRFVIALPIRDANQ